VAAAIKVPTAAPPTPAAVAEITTAPSASLAVDAGRLRISPRASRLAADSGIDPRTIVGTGPEGRITERDVRAALVAASVTPAAPQSAAPIAAPVSAPASRPPEPAVDIWNADAEPRHMSRMRRVIAERLTLSATTVPQFTVTVAVDASRLLMLRAELKAAGTSLTVTDFIVFAVARSFRTSTHEPTGRWCGLAGASTSGSQSRCPTDSWFR
jgi:pyruvate dehydrogenase E2 component (dihydrolipoamide acetyltransferase)